MVLIFSYFITQLMFIMKELQYRQQKSEMNFVKFAAELMIGRELI